MKTYIVRDKEVMSGAPIILGTRVPVERLVSLIEQGYTEDTLKREFPHISRAKIRGALSQLVVSGLRTI